MGKEELEERYHALDEKSREKFLEKIAFCNFSDERDFENYFSLETLEESELDCLTSFLYQQDCFLMLLDIPGRYRKRFASHDLTLLDEVDFSDRFSSRWDRLEKSEKPRCLQENKRDMKN